jgi:prolyl oligopeptidase
MMTGNANSLDLEADDPFLWLEDITGERARAWVRERNAETERALAGHGPADLEKRILEVLDSNNRIPFITRRGTSYTNFWQDETNPRGRWRRTSLEEYRKTEPAWETILDLDELCRTENENWVFKGAEYLWPEHGRCLVQLSRGGADAVVVREFDLESKAFVPDGFVLPEARTRVSWIGRDLIFVATNFGIDTLTASGYPRIVKRWRRGTPLSAAETVFEAARTDAMAGAIHDPCPGFERDVIFCMHSMLSIEQLLLRPDGSRVRIDVPEDAQAGWFREWLTVSLRTPWTVAGRTHPAGALLAARFDDFIAGGRDFVTLHQPDDRSSRAECETTRNHLLLSVLEDVKTKVWALTPGPGEWKREALAGVPGFGTTGVWPVDGVESDEYFMSTTDSLTPTELFLGNVGGSVERLKRLPAFFDAAGLEITQHFTTSADGTRVPYFQVAARDLRPDGTHPTLLTGYGGFEIPLLPHYNGVRGRAWLEAGGVYALANIRGGGEYGPRWHLAAVKQNRPRAYEDFAAVARDLIARGVTSPRRLGIEGGSNGGLLVGNMLVRYPELFGAVVCQSPDLDMKRFTRLFTGPAFTDEYGDPDKPEEWSFLRALSPYHNVKPGAAYPPVLFMTSTRDDRVHPGHARKMAALMQSMGYNALFFETDEGGHGSGADNRQTAHYEALVFAFLWKHLSATGDAAP